MPQRLLPALLAGAACLALASVQGHAAAAPRDRIDAIVEAQMAADRIPGVAVAVLERGAAPRIRVYGLADVAASRPVARDTLFQVGSVSKVYTAALAARLAARGVVDLDAPASKYLAADVPPLTDPDGRPPSLRALLRHEAGLPRDRPQRRNLRLDSPYDLGVAEAVTRAEFVASLAGVRTQWPATGRWYYSNLGVDLAGLALADAGRRPLHELMRAELFEPAGLRDTRVYLDDALFARTARHYWDADAKRLERPRWQFGDVWASGGIATTIDDLARFASYLMTTREPALAPAALCRDPLPLVRDAEYAAYYEQCLGFRRRRLGDAGWFYGHAGEVDGNTAYLSIAEDGRLAVAVLANLGPVAAQRIGSLLEFEYALQPTERGR